jgi:hypothetical protein
MAKVAMDKAEAMKAYQAHVIDAQENGDKPMAFDDFFAQHQAQKQEDAKAAADALKAQKDGYSSVNQ